MVAISTFAGCAPSHPTVSVREHPEAALVLLEVGFSDHHSNCLGFLVPGDGMIAAVRHELDGAVIIRAALSDGRAVPAKVMDEDARGDVIVLRAMGVNNPQYPAVPVFSFSEDDFEPGAHVRVVIAGAIVHGVFDHWENVGQDISIASSFPGGAVGAPVLADDGRVIGIVRGRSSDGQLLATPSWRIARLLPR